MSTKYFNPIEFPELDKPEPKEVPVDPGITVDITEKLKAVRKEISNIRQGTSTLRKGAMQFPKGEAPILAALKTLEANPTSRNALWNMIAIAKQDLGVSVMRFLVDLFIDVDPELERLK